MTTGEEMAERIAQAAPGLVATRDAAREAAGQAIFEVQARIRIALAGEPLRGMADLNPSGERWCGARVQGHGRYNHDLFLTPGKRALCVSQAGELVLATLEGRAVVARAAQRTDLRAEDLEPYLRVIDYVATRHSISKERTAAVYARVERLAAAVRRALAAEP